MNMKISLCVRIATLGPVGYLMASGTAATLLTMPLMYLLRVWLPSGPYLMLLIASLLVAVPIINCALEYFKEDQDPSQIVLDEVHRLFSNILFDTSLLADNACGICTF